MVRIVHSVENHMHRSSILGIAKNKKKREWMGFKDHTMTGCREGCDEGIRDGCPEGRIIG